MVRVLFRSKALRDRCSDSAAMTEAWGKEAAAAVRRRLQQIAAAATLDDLAFLPCHVTDSDSKHQLSLHGQLTLVITCERDSTKNREVPDFQTIVVEDIREIQRACR